MLFAIIGGPSVGKTSIIQALHEEGEIVCFEAATDIILAEKASGNPAPWESDGFQMRIFEEKLKREGQALEQACQKGKQRIFVDRGLLEDLVYLETNDKQDSNEYKQIAELMAKLHLHSHYKAIFYVEPYNGSEFQLVEDPSRHETTEGALDLAQKIYAAYALSSTPIINVPPHMTPQERAAFILKSIQQL